MIHVYGCKQYIVKIHNKSTDMQNPCHLLMILAITYIWGIGHLPLYCPSQLFSMFQHATWEGTRLQMLHIRNWPLAVYTRLPYIPACALRIRNSLNYSSERAMHKELSKPHLQHHPSSGGHVDRRTVWTDRKFPNDAVTLCLRFAARVNYRIGYEYITWFSTVSQLTC